MHLYNDYVVPHLTHLAMGRKQLASYRAYPARNGDIPADGPRPVPGV